jgi:hypothetical protein
MFGFRKKAEQKKEEPVMTPVTTPRPVLIQGSARSQASLLKEQHLRAEIEKFTAAKVQAEGRILEFEGQKAEISRRLILENPPGASLTQTAFADACSEIAKERAFIESLDAQIAAREAAISKLTPSPEELETRNALQQAAAQLSVERMAVDSQIGELVTGLLGLVAERDECSEGLAKIVDQLDLPTAYTELRRYDLGALRQVLAAFDPEASQEWHDWFCGHGGGAMYVVTDENGIRVEETLSHSGIYSFGERLELREKEAVELLREDRPAEDIPAWRYLPARILPLEKFEEAARAAEAEGVSVAHYLRLQHHAKQEPLWDADHPVPNNNEGRRFA